MQCPHCGAEQGQDNVFCTTCGSKLARASRIPTYKTDTSKKEVMVSASSKTEEEKILRELKEALKGVEDPQTSSGQSDVRSTEFAGKAWVAGGLAMLILLCVLAFIFIQKAKQGPPPPSPIESALEPEPTPSTTDEATRTTVGKMAAILEAIGEYSKTKKALPPSLTALNRGYSNPESIKDGWGQNLLYLVDLTNKTFVIRSLGPDGKRETSDDLSVTHEDMGPWLKNHGQTISEWRVANPNLYAQLTSVGPSLEELKKVQAERKAKEEKERQELEAKEEERRQEAEQRRLESIRLEQEKRKQAEAQRQEEELRQAKAREKVLRQRQAAQQSIELKDNFTNGLLQWDAPSSWEIVKDKEFSGLKVQGLGFLKKGENWDNYKMEFDIKINKESAGWVVRAQNSNNFYLFKLGSDRAKAIPKNSLVKYIYSDGKYLNSLKREDAPGAVGVTPLPFKVKNKDFHRVVVMVKGNTITHYINGIQVDSWNDNTFERGRFGFNASIIEMATIRSVSVEPVR